MVGGQKIRQAFNKETIGIILNLAIEKNATNIITTLIEGATQEDKKLLIQIDQKDENSLFNALKRNNIALAEQLIEGLSEQDIKQALKGIFKDVLEMAKTKNATQVIAKLEEKTTEETKI